MGQLVQLELENFKSYRGKQVIGPFTNFTAVVGPNGAGKSNLMDAISFVLGVQSTHLRSSHLKDLVYRGRTIETTRSGKVIDEAGEQEGRKAWVRAVYEDDDGHWIPFQRTITGSGASEYRINNRVVSQQTYTQALESQNILVRAKNFLVFQGDVEAVASQSPADLTRLVEQISGSWELKSEYEKLEKRQAAAAEKSTYAFNKKRTVVSEVQSIVEQKKELDLYESKLRLRSKRVVEQMLFRLYVAECRIKDLNKEMNALEGSSKGQATQNFQEIESKLHSVQKSQAKSFKVVARQERQIKVIEKQIETRQPVLAGINEKVVHTERKVQRVNENFERARADVERQTKAVELLVSEITRAKAAEERFKEEVLEAQARHGEQANSEQTIAEYARLDEQLHAAAVEDFHKRDTLDRQIAIMAESARRTKDKADALQLQCNGLEASERSAEQQLELSEQLSSAAMRELQNARQEVEKARTEHERLVQVEIQLNEKLSGVLKKLSQARAEQRESAREAKLKDTISALQRVFPGVHGRLSDLCKPTQRKYDVAISTVLGRHMDAIVVDQQSVAIECINYMKEQRAGQATFLPLDTIQPPQINESLRHAHPSARLATDILQFDSSVEPAVMYACTNTLVCDSVDAARTVCYDRRLNAKAVTLDGTVIHRSGLITGGTSSTRAGNTRAQAKRWEAKDVEDLRKARERLTDELHAVARDRRALSKEELVAARVSGLEAKYQFARESTEAFRRKIQGISAEIKHVRQQLAESESVAQEAAFELEETKGERESVSSRIYAAAEPIFADFCQSLGIANLEEFEKQQQLYVSDRTTERQLEFTTHISRIESQCEFERQQLEETKAVLEHLTRTLSSDQIALSSLKSDLARETEAMAQLVQQIESKRRELGNLTSEYSNATEIVHETRRDLESKQKEIYQMDRTLSARRTELERARSDKSAILRRCKLDDIQIPLRHGSLQALALDAVPTNRASASFSLSQASGSYLSQPTDYGSQISNSDVQDLNDIEPDFSQLPQASKSGSPPEIEQRYQTEISKLTNEIDALNPNPYARERLEAARVRLREIENEHNMARNESKQAKVDFQVVRKRRHDRFMKCYNHLSSAIDHAYKALTMSPVFPLGGTAYLALEDQDSPYLSGIKYHAMPPLKRFRDMDQLSGGEKTVAALALLFSLQTFRPAPFFVLDEVDAALDLANVTKLANYLREHARKSSNINEEEEEEDMDEDQGDLDVLNTSHYSLRQSARVKKGTSKEGKSSKEANFQFIVISLKQALYERAQSLVGIYRDQDENSSRVLTVDLEQFPA